MTSGGPKEAVFALSDPVDQYQWRHFAFTVGNGEIKAYREGVLMQTTSYAGSTVTVGTGPVRIGGSATEPGYGRFDEIAHIPKVLTQAEILEIAQSKHRTVPAQYRLEIMKRSPEVWFRMNEPFAPGYQYMYDSSLQSRHGSYLGDPIRGRPGPMNESCLTIERETALSRYGHHDPGYWGAYQSTSGTVVIWHRMTILPLNGGIVEKTQGALFAGQVNREWLLFQEGMVTIWRVMYNNGASQTQITYPNTDQDLGQWHLWVGVLSPTGIKLYRDEQLVNAIALTMTVPHAAGEVVFGKLGSEIYPGDGDLADYAFFARELTHDDVRAIYRSRRLHLAEYDVYVGPDPPVLHAGQFEPSRRASRSRSPKPMSA